jgi:CRISPR-associated protein Cas6
MAAGGPVVDLMFPIVQSAMVHVDHGHALYGAIKQACPAIQDIPSLGIHTLRGLAIPGGMLMLGDRSPLRLRIPAETIHIALPLAGKVLQVVEASVRLGAPTIHVLSPAPALWARTVTMKFADTDNTAAEKQLRSHLEQDYPEVRFSIRRSRTIRIHGKQILGFEILAEKLGESDSLKLQEEGFGGRRAFGCGIFVVVGSKPNTTSAARSHAVGHGRA